MKAKRGDLVVIVQNVRDYYTNGPVRTRTQVSAGKVTSVTREGVVKTAMIPFDAESDGSWSKERSDSSRTLIVPKDQVDVESAIDAYRQQRYPSTDSTMVRPLDSVDAMRELLRPFLTRAEEA